MAKPSRTKKETPEAPILSDFRLDGRVAIVTGAGRGIGRAIALALADAGADVAVAARTRSEIEVVAKDVRALGRQALVAPTDVSKSKEVDALVAKTLDRFSKVDILVNNAGAYREVAVAPFPDKVLRPPAVMRDTSSRMTDEEFRVVMDTNIGGVFYGCRAVAPHMLARRSGKIINVSSIVGITAYKLEAAYDASKAAVNMLTRCLALEWAAYNVCVNALAPGDYNTSMTAEAWNDPKRRKAYLKSIPMGREGDMRNLGSLAVYLASPASNYVTGQVIYIDGGITAS